MIELPLAYQVMAATKNEYFQIEASLALKNGLKVPYIEDNLPDMNGFKVCELLKHMYQQGKYLS